MKKPAGGGSTSSTSTSGKQRSRATPTVQALAPQGGIARVSVPPMARGSMRPTPQGDGGPITDVNTLAVVSPDIAAKIKAAAGLAPEPQAAPMRAEAAISPLPEQVRPGTERWHVKTGQDQDRAKVGKNVIDGEALGAGIVESTVEELASLPRPAGLEDIRADPTEFQDVRDGVAEVTIWRIETRIIALKHEADGDYHLVLQGASGQEMIAEIPTPSAAFVGDSPWLDNFSQARKEVDDKLVKHLSPAAFGLVQGKFMPHGATMFQPRAAAGPGVSFVTPPPGSALSQPLFQTAIPPTPARITGVGFFDREHGATGAAPNVIELHPVLKIEWL